MHLTVEKIVAAKKLLEQQAEHDGKYHVRMSPYTMASIVGEYARHRWKQAYRNHRLTVRALRARNIVVEVVV